MPENNVTIPLDDYKVLVQISNEFDILLNALLSHAKLNYSEEELSFSDSIISHIVKAISPSDYEAVFRKLKKEKEIKNESVD